jgi:Cu+-exporting ATPase
MSIMVGTGRGAQSGVLVKNAEALERMERVDTLVLDKTGTLTEGKPRLVSIVPAPGHDEAELLRVAAALEAGSEHPLAAAILADAKQRGIAFEPAQGFSAVSGKGVTGKVDGRRAALGNAALLDELHVDPSPLRARADELGRNAETVVFVVLDRQLLGLLGVADPIKEGAKEALDELRRDGLRIAMLTGDSRATARVIAARLGIEEVIAEVLPDQKHAAIARLQKQGRVVAMAGDGINDAPALAQADIGIAMGTGTDVAMESADITLVRGDLRGIVRARRLSRATMRNIRQNLFFAFIYNAIGVPLAALGLLDPMIASAAMSLSSVSVIGNALRLRGA